MNNEPTQTLLPAAHTFHHYGHTFPPLAHTRTVPPHADTTGSLPAHFAAVMLSELPGVHKTGTAVTGTWSYSSSATLCSSPIAHHTCGIPCLPGAALFTQESGLQLTPATDTSGYSTYTPGTCQTHATHKWGPGHHSIER